MSKSPSLRRIQADIRELARDPSDQYFAAPMENDMFVWHFTIRGAEGTDFEGGIYHGRILLPAEYPYKPPHIIFLTPSGRFETNTKICLSFSAFHPELWQPAWGIRLILEALISFLPTPGDGAIGALDYKPEERRRLAKKSQSFCCPIVGPVAKLLPKLDPDRKKSPKRAGSSEFSKQVAELQRLQQEREGGKNRCKNTKDGIKTEETTTTTPTSEAGEAKPKTEARIAEDAKCSRDVPELLSADATKDDNPAGSTIGENTDGDAPLTDSNAATADNNANDSGGTASDTATVSEEEPGNTVAAAHYTPRSNVDDVDNDMSKLYDPLLNISIFLMFCICVLLCKKGMSLSRELNELRAIPIVDTFMDKATSAASSVAASEEL